MTPEQAYRKFIVKINKNAQTNNISCDRGRFVLIFNEAQNKEVEHILEIRGKDDIRYLQKILVPEVILTPSIETTDRFERFQLPLNFFNHSTAHGTATKGECENEIIDLHEIKSENENFHYQDEHDTPSFEWRESFYYFSQDSIKAFKKEFSLNDIRLTYYRYPSQISLIDIQNPESQFSTTEIEFDDKIVDRMISRAASDFELNNNSPKFQADLQRSNQK